MNKFIITILIVVFLSACLAKSGKDCGADEKCFNDAVKSGEKANAVITTTINNDFGDVGSEGNVVYNIEVTGKDNNAVFVKKIVSKIEFTKENKSSTLKSLEGTEVTCKLALKDLGTGDIKGAEDTAMTNSMNIQFDNGLKITQKSDGPCKGSMIDAFAKVLSSK